MQINYKIFLFISILCIATTAQGKIYQWTDENGQKHFGQTPPPKQIGKKAPKVEIRKEKFSTIRNIRKTEHGKYCGEIRLNESKDPVIQLANVDSNQKNWLKNIQRQQARIAKFTEEQLEFDTNPRKTGNNNNIIKRTQKKIDDLQCAYSWSKREKARLKNVIKEFEEELDQVREEYASIKNRCGAKPDVEGWTTDKEAIAWAECKSKRHSIKEHNKKLRELKAMESKARILSEVKQ